jgi:hypothetical protein
MASVDQGLLAVLNSAMPNCPVSQEYAKWATSSGMKSVAKGAACGEGYVKINPNSVQPSGLAGNDQYDVCATVNPNTSLPPAEVTNGMLACLKNASPGTTAPTASKGLAWWAWLLIAFGIILFIVLVLLFLRSRRRVSPI